VPVDDEQADFDRLSAGILAGRGVVARYPGVVCVADADGAEPVRALVAVCAAVAGFEPGRPLARRLAAWLSGPDAPPSSLRFGTLADAGDRWAVFLSGAVSLHDAGTDATIPGAEAAAWTDRLVTPGGPLVLLLDALEEDRPRGRADDPFADLHDLRAGAVPGRGVVLATASAARHAAVPPLPAPAAPPPPAAAAPAAPPPPAAPAAAEAPPPAAPLHAAPPLAGAAPQPPSSPPPAPSAPDAAPPPSAFEAADADPAPVDLGKARALHAEPTMGRAVPDEEPIEVTVGDGSGPPPIPPAPRADEPPVRPPRRSALIAGAPAAPQRPPLTPGRPLSPARGGPRPDGNAPRGPAAPRDRDDSPVIEGPSTRGHLCSRGHLNDPRSHFCVLCGIRMNERTGELVFGPRPPLGLLVFDDGATYTVDAEYLVGRMPDVDERVRNGSLRSIVVEDRSGAVSRVHAEVRVDGWDVMLVDSRSRNGTHIAGPGASAWTTVPAGRSHRLTPGTRVRLGSRTFLFESPSGVR
jgi:hypothetical protein